MCWPVPACPRTPSPAASPLEKTTFPPTGNPKLTRHRCAFPAREPGGGTDKQSFVLRSSPQPLRTPHAWPQKHRPPHGAPDLSPNCREAAENRKGPPAKGPRTDAPGGTGAPRPSLRTHPQDCPAVGGTAGHHQGLKRALYPHRAHPHRQSWGCLTSSRLWPQLLPQQTPSDGTDPPDPALTQLCRIWVTAVSHGHPESDSTLLEGPDPAVDFPRKENPKG